MSKQISDEGATAVITHWVCADKHPEYENWLKEIGPQCRAFPGHLDLHIIRPISGVTDTYTIIIRFDTKDHLQSWMASSTRARLIEKASPLLAKGDSFFISSGLDFWFTPQGAQARIPIRWKQLLVTWSAIYPLVLCLPLVIVPLLRALGLPQILYLDMLVITGTVAALMIYVVMPRYTRLIQTWLFN